MPPFPLESCLSTHMPSARHAESAPIDAILSSRARTTPFAYSGDDRMKQIAIVGGGPAGALCGEKLAVAGFDVTLFDEHLAWEKPCGGGLTHKAIEKYPFLLNGPQAKKEIHTAELISSKGHRARFEMSRPIVIYSRAVLNGLLLDRAAAAGCETVHARVTRVETHAGEDESAPRVTLTAGGKEHSAD